MLTRGRSSASSGTATPLAALCLVLVVAVTSAAPVLRDAAAAKQDSEKPLVRAKRADEIIFDNEQNSAAGDSAASLPVKKSEPIDVTKEEDSSSAESSKPETDLSDQGPASDDNSAAVGDVSSESSDNSQQQSADSSDPVTWDSDAEDEKKRRRRSAASKADSKEADPAVRTRRAASAAMVAENMAAPGTGSSRRQRAKRDLDADEIREIIESRRPLVGEGREADYAGSDYGSPRDYYEDAPVPSSDEQEEEAEGDEGVEYEDTDEDGDEDQYGGRPKRRPALTDEEREEVLEEAERQVVRELLAERAAEETRQALLNYLSGNNGLETPIYQHRISERYDDEFRNEGGDDEAYEEEDEEDNGEEEEGGEDEEGLSEDEEQGLEGQEELVEDGDGRFLVDEQAEDSDEGDAPAAGEKRFSFPYTYEPYGGRWGALVPGSKRADHDPYDRLYQLAEALSRPSSIGGAQATDDEYKKK